MSHFWEISAMDRGAEGQKNRQIDNIIKYQRTTGLFINAIKNPAI